MRKRIRVHLDVSIALDQLFFRLIRSVDLKIWMVCKHGAQVNEISLVTTPVYDYWGDYNR